LAEIETFLDKPIDVLQISKADYEGTIDFSNDTAGNVKSLLEEIEALEAEKKVRKGKKMNRKK